MTTDTQYVLEINNVSKSFAGKRAVKNVSFQVGKGEIVGFLGPNGAGKTTTLRMALGLITPDAKDGGVYQIIWRRSRAACIWPCWFFARRARALPQNFGSATLLPILPNLTV